ncbi:hypothetical protein [Cellulomonas iranensis]|uniref:hypothetical protein n=1 Tax=Cellulomonas iranensis TaxID=76862 RepID=UPI003D7E22A7
MTTPSGHEPDDSDDSLGLGERIASGVFAACLVAAGVFATIESSNDIASAALTLAGVLFAYLAISGSSVRSWSVGGNAVNLTRRRKLREARRIETELEESATEEQEERIAFEALEYEEVLPAQVRVATSKIRSRSRRKAEVVAEIATESDLPDPGIGVGSSVSSRFFGQLAVRWGVPSGSMPDIGKAIVEKAGGRWDEACFSLGSTVTVEGLERILAATRRLRASEREAPSGS